MTESWTVRRVVDLAVEHGLVDGEAVLSDLGDLDRVLGRDGEPDQWAVMSFLIRLGIVYQPDWKSFRGAYEDGLELYEEELGLIAACGRGLLTIADVELVETDRETLLRFTCNGERHEWPVAHGPGADEDGEAQLTFGTYINGLVPSGSPERWCFVVPLQPGDTPELVFADPDALRRFGSRLGLPPDWFDALR